MTSALYIFSLYSTRDSCRTKTKAAVYWLCVLSSEVVSQPDHQQDLYVFSFHSLWVVLIEAVADVPTSSRRGVFGVFGFQALSSHHWAPLYNNTVLLNVSSGTWCLEFILLALARTQLAWCLNKSKPWKEVCELENEPKAEFGNMQERDPETFQSHEQRK